MPFNFQFKTEMGKDNFAHFNFLFQIENQKMITIFYFSNSNSFFRKFRIENPFFLFQFSNYASKETVTGFFSNLVRAEVMPKFYP